jgi:hypothetical protein
VAPVSEAAIQGWKGSKGWCFRFLPPSLLSLFSLYLSIKKKTLLTLSTLYT